MWLFNESSSLCVAAQDLLQAKNKKTKTFKGPAPTLCIWLGPRSLTSFLIMSTTTSTVVTSGRSSSFAGTTICAAPCAGSLCPPASWCPAPTPVLRAGRPSTRESWLQHTSHYATEYVCLDENPESDPLLHLFRRDAFKLYYVRVVCDSLRCPPYLKNKAVLCVVCSK